MRRTRRLTVARRVGLIAPSLGTSKQSTCGKKLGGRVVPAQPLRRGSETVPRTDEHVMGAETSFSTVR